MHESNKLPSNKRASTEDELAFLSDVLSSLSTPKRRYLKAALNTAVFWIFSLVGFCILWFILGLLSSAIINVDIGISSKYSNIIFPVAIITSAFFALKSTKSWLQDTDQLYKKVKVDLSEKQTTSENFQTIAVKCFQEPEP